MRLRKVQMTNIIEFPRADPGALAMFDPNTRLCQMNCGPHTHDPRTDKERKFLCSDCAPQPSLLYNATEEKHV